MKEHSIEELVRTSLNSIKEMVDVNTVIGDAVESTDGTVIIPISRVSFGFAAGGAGCDGETMEGKQGFGGGSGAGVSVKPVGFLVCAPEHGIRFMNVSANRTYERLLDIIPLAMDKIAEIFPQDMMKQRRKEEPFQVYEMNTETESD